MMLGGVVVWELKLVKVSCRTQLVLLREVAK